MYTGEEEELTWCTISDEEQEKCEDLAKAVKEKFSDFFTSRITWNKPRISYNIGCQKVSYNVGLSVFHLFLGMHLLIFGGNERASKWHLSTTSN